jgi:hypothetical protein
LWAVLTEVASLSAVVVEISKINKVESFYSLRVQVL